MAIDAEHALRDGRADAAMVRPIFTLPHALGVQLGGRRGNAANGVPGEGRQFQLQSGQGRQRTTARPAFADTHASSTASRNSLHRSHGLTKALRSGIRLVESFLTGLSFPAELPAIVCRRTADMASRPIARSKTGAPNLHHSKRNRELQRGWSCKPLSQVDLGNLGEPHGCGKARFDMRRGR